jgi:hypothetical protein
MMTGRAPLYGAIGLGLLALGLCFVPLFDLLGYEFSFAIGLASVVTAHLIGRAAARADTARAALTGALVRAAGHLVPALLVMTLNALRVRNCDYWAGMQFYLLLPVASSMYSAALGVLVGRVFRSRRWSRAASLAVVLAPLSWSLRLLYTEPPIFAFDHLWGHFAGSLYDEAVGVTPVLWWFRLGTLLRVAGIAGLLWVWERRRYLTLGRSWATALGLFFAMWAYDRWEGPRAGFHVTRAAIEAALPLEVTIDRLVIHLPAGTSPEVQRAVALDHLFRLRDLERRLDVRTDGTIHSYVYPNSATKARLMGGENTMVAKPWLREIHVHDVLTEHPVVAHELVHVLAGELAPGPLRVSAKWRVLVNMGLVEGLAEALTPERGALDLDAYARAMRVLKMAPDMRELLGPAGFWGAAPRRAYTIAGSFVSFLLEKHGAARLKRVYADGDFEAAYGRPLDELVREWEANIDALVVLPRDERRAEERFRIPSIFARPCAHVIAQLEAKARNAAPAAAIGIREEICRHLGDSPSARMDLARAKRAAGDDDGFLALSAELLGSDGLFAAQRAALLEERGEVLWKRADFAQAHNAFAAVLALEPELSSERLQWVRLWALDEAPEVRDAVRALLMREATPVVSTLALARLADARGAPKPEDRTLPYLVGRQLLNVKAWRDGVEWLERAGPHPSAAIEAERVRLIAEARYALGELDAAASAYGTYADLAPSSGERARAKDWLQRIAFMKEQPPS